MPSQKALWILRDVLLLVVVVGSWFCSWISRFTTWQRLQTYKVAIEIIPMTGSVPNLVLSARLLLAFGFASCTKPSGLIATMRRFWRWLSIKKCPVPESGRPTENFQPCCSARAVDPANYTKRRLVTLWKTFCYMFVSVNRRNNEARGFTDTNA